MRRPMAYDEQLRKILRKFIVMPSREAVNFKVYGTESKNLPTKYTAASSSTCTQRKDKQHGPKKDRTKQEISYCEKPPCLWEEQSKKCIRHYLRNCKECSKEENDRLFDNCRSTKEEFAKRTKDQEKNLENTSVVFNTKFGGRHRVTICADICSDDNIIDKHTVEELKKAGVEPTIENIFNPRTLHMAANLPDGKPATLMVKEAFVVDTELHIRHGTYLTLRGLRWLVTDKIVGDPLLRRPLLEALELNIRNVLAAAALRHSGVFEVSSLFSSDNGSHGKETRILEGVYQADGVSDDAELYEEDGYWKESLLADS